MLYPEALQQIRAAKIPWPIVAQHLKHGVKEGEVCGTCTAFEEYWGSGAKGQVVVSHYCRRAYSSQTVAPETLACGKWNVVEDGRRTEETDP